MTACNSLSTKNNYDSDQVNLLLEQQQKADIAYASNDWKLAVQHYEALVKSYPNHDVSWFRLGNSHSELGQNKKALAAYDKAIELNPNNTKAWHNKGTLQLRMATDTFFKMQEYASESDSYAKRGLYVVKSIEDILQQGFGITIENE